MSWVPNWKSFYSIIIMNVFKMISKWCQNLNGIIIHYTICSQLKIKLYIWFRLFHKSNNKCEIEFLQIYKEHVTKKSFFQLFDKKTCRFKIDPKKQIGFHNLKNIHFYLCIWKANDCIGLKTCMKLMHSFINN